jgi:glutamyl/glutaminyl-tRNA synthetase
MPIKFYLLGSNALQSNKRQTTFLNNISPPSSGSESKTSKKQTANRATRVRKQVWSACRLLLLVSCLAYSSTLKMEAIFFSKMLTDFHRTHDVTSQKTQLFRDLNKFAMSPYFIAGDSQKITCRDAMSWRPKRLIFVTLTPRQDQTEDGTNSISRMLQSYEASLGLSVALSKRHCADSNGRVVQDSDGAVLLKKSKLRGF